MSVISKFLDGLFFPKIWLNGARIIDVPQDIEYTGLVNVSTVSGRTLVNVSGTDPNAFFAFGSPVANTGKLRFGAGASGAPIPIMYGLKADGTTAVPLIRWGAGANNRLHVGDGATGALDSLVMADSFSRSPCQAPG